MLQIHLKTNPNRNTFPVQHYTSNLVKKIRFSDDEDDFLCKEKDKRQSYGNERIVKPNRTTPGRDSISSTKSIKDHVEYLKQKIKDLSVGSSHIGQLCRGKMNGEKPSLVKTPKYTPGKAFVTPRKQEEPAKTIQCIDL